MKNIFTDHPRSVGETYVEHFFFACSFGIKMVIGGLACVLHAVFPFLFQKTASETLVKLLKNFVERMPNVDKQILMLAKTIQDKTENPKSTM